MRMAAGIRRAVKIHPKNSLINLEKELREEYQFILEHEKIILDLKSKTDWS